MKNNLLIYKANIQTLGDLPDTEAVVGVIDKVDYLVVDMPGLLADQATLVEVLNAAKTINRTIKVFGRVTLGADDVACIAEMNTWMVLAGSLLSGFLVEKFGLKVDLATRTGQNAVVAAAHALEKSVIAETESPFNVFEPYPAEPTPTFGRSANVRDYLLVEDFFLAYGGAPGADPVTEKPEHLAARSEYLKAARFDRLNNDEPLNWGMLVVTNAGGLGALNETVFKNALKAAEALGVDGYGIAPDDYGAVSHRFFLGQVANRI